MHSCSFLTGALHYLHILLLDGASFPALVFVCHEMSIAVHGAVQDYPVSLVLVSLVLRRGVSGFVFTKPPLAVFLPSKVLDVVILVDLSGIPLHATPAPRHFSSLRQLLLRIPQVAGAGAEV